ncbi:alpha/beta-hydrolase [Massarina eburnea CBS 473.64]|uniref:Alpha/beta-hydrolase n=1 Tax=Massarina eburnea CBS 473.64 TaxID=1395130 RepID=A0A6A6RRR2_9PLEO|nr:alpha/beta-hydrolase [Massarina eburnea CBS 473.64]
MAPLGGFIVPSDIDVGRPKTISRLVRLEYTIKYKDLSSCLINTPPKSHIINPTVRSSQTFIMNTYTFLSLLPLLAFSNAAPTSNIEGRAASSACPSYTIINTRGTGEAQGPSSGFRTMNSGITGQLTGGKIYNTVYPAAASQNSAAGTTDIVNKITSTLKTSPKECFILEGYSQGAAATVNAMPKLTGSAFDAVKGVFLIGDPSHKAGLACNVDNNGGDTTKGVNGLSGGAGGGIPSNWVGKTLDVCIFVSLISWC